MYQELFRIVLGSVLLAGGLVACDAPPTTPEVVSDVQQDIAHEHRHVHGSGQLHDHEHPAGFEGSHAHEHQHQHRHSEPPHGGQLIEVTPLFPENRKNHFHAEVLPITSGSLTFYLLDETPDGGFQDLEIDVSAMEGLLTAGDSSAASGTDAVVSRSGVEFVSGDMSGNQGQPSSQFFTQIPDEFMDQDAVTVAIPEMQIRGQTYTLSFRVLADGRVEP